ncbi:MAG: isopenicillin N synthase-like dioxygenase [Candidatus Azotimanducaceae bacterium]|jgi:isopenicillin N synthase-like dioxygenase
MKVSTVDLKQDGAAKAVTDSLLESGFAAVINHPIEASELDALYQKWDHFFTTGEPQQYATDAGSQAGYFSSSLAETAKGQEAQDLKEYFQYWPGGVLPESLIDLTLRYYDAMFSLGKDVMTWLQANTPADLWSSTNKPIAEYLSREQTLLRILRYPPLNGDEPKGALRAGAHEDINLITMLPSANEPGLELKLKDSDEWIPVEAPAGAIIMNIGDMLQELTQGALPSTTHRVVNPSGDNARRARLTAPVFCHPYPSMVLSDRYTAGSYLKERLDEINSDELKPSGAS